MSLVLDALEKTQRQLGDRPLLKPQPIKNPRRGHKLFIFNLILIVAIINLSFLKWWLNRNSAEISVNMPAVTTSPIPRLDIIPKKNPAHRIDVTGIVWDKTDPIVLVNSKFLKKGDEILGARIVEVFPHEVRFLRGEEEFTVSVE